MAGRTASAGRLRNGGTTGLGPPGPLSKDSSLASWGDGSFSAAKVAPALLPSSSVLSTPASFHGSCISDLRAAVVAQQRQFDALVDRIAAILSAMHTEMAHDLRGALDGQVNARLEELRRPGAELDSRRAELGCRLGELREAENRDCSMAHMQSQQEHGKLREWLASELQQTSSHVSVELQALHDRLDGETRAAHERLSVGLEDLQGRLADKLDGLRSCLDEDTRGLHERLHALESSVLMADDASAAWQLAIDHACLCLREDLLRELKDGVCSPLRLRVLALEERLLGGPGLPAPLPKGGMQPEDGAPGQTRDRLDRLEADARRRESTLERLEDDIRRLRRADGASSSEREAWLAEWQRRAEDQHRAVLSVEARIGELEHWQRCAGEFLEFSAGQQSRAGPLQGQSSVGEQRPDAPHDRVQSMMDFLQQQARQSPQQQACPGAGGHRAAMRVEEALAVSMSQDSWHHGNKELCMGEKFEALGLRVGGAEAAIESLKSQISELRTKMFRSLSPVPEFAGGTEHALQVQAAMRVMGADLRQDLEAHLSQLAQHASQQEGRRLAKELHQDLEDRLELKGRASQCQAEELRRELEAQLQHVQGSLQRLQEDLRQELGAKVAQAQWLTAELRRELEVQAAEKDRCAQGIVESRLEACMAQTRQVAQSLAVQLRQEMEAHLKQAHGTMQHLAGEFREGLREVASLRADLRGAQAFGKDPRPKDPEAEVQASVAQTVAASVAAELGEHPGKPLAEAVQERTPGPAHETEVEELTRLNKVLRKELEGYALEKKISHCLAGLEHGRRLQSVRDAGGGMPATALDTAPLPDLPMQLSWRPLRKAASTENISAGRAGSRAAGAAAGIGCCARRADSLCSRSGHQDPHALSFEQKQKLFRTREQHKCNGR